MKSIHTYPEDYDGAMAGAPTWWMTHQAFYNYKQTTIGGLAHSNSSIPPTLYPVITDEVLRQCDPQDKAHGLHHLKPTRLLLPPRSPSLQQ